MFLVYFYEDQFLENFYYSLNPEDKYINEQIEKQFRQMEEMEEQEEEEEKN